MRKVRITHQDALCYLDVRQVRPFRLELRDEGSKVLYGAPVVSAKWVEALDDSMLHHDEPRRSHLPAS